MLTYASNARRFHRVLLEAASPILSRHPISSPHYSGVPQLLRALSLLAPRHEAGVAQEGVLHSSDDVRNLKCFCSPTGRAYSTSVAVDDSEVPTETVKDMCEKILISVEEKSTPPNAWLWSVIGSCANKKDIDLLFQTLYNLRKFRLSALRITEDFNSHLCQRVVEACARVGAFNYGLKALWKHNIYGLTPSIASAHYLLRHAKEQNDCHLMERTMRVLQKNGLPLQPGTADIIFSICYDTNKWDLISKYSIKFIKAGVKFHQATFDIWMEFSANRGDSVSIWEVEKLRSSSTKHQSLSSAFSCVKGFLLDGKAENAAAVLHVLSQNLSDQKKTNFAKELQKLAKWPKEVGKHYRGDRKALISSLKNEMSKMVDSLSNMGVDVKNSLEVNDAG